MADLFKTVGDAIQSVENRKLEFDPYYFFEPWDCDMPDPETLKAAMEDGVDLEDDPAIHLSGQYPRSFQTESILSDKEMVCCQAGSRSGKSICTLVVIGAMISRKPPYAFRYEKGEDTGIRRPITEENIRRFGRVHAVTGELIDHDAFAEQDASWHCGNVVGCGIFPEKLYPKDGEQIWVGTVAKSIDTFWWPALTGEGSKRFLPKEFFDHSKGNKGSNKQAGMVHAIRDIDIHLKTYEQGHTKFESQTAWLLAWDEEPPKPDIYISGAVHATYQRFSFTPLKGRTWSEELFFNCLRKEYHKKGAGLNRSDFDYFYASQFDSPFVDRKKLQRDRRGMEIWERKARIWGQYSEYAGQPFFNREKIHFWRKHFCREYVKARYRTTAMWQGMYGSSVENVPGLLQVRSVPETAQEEDGRYVWRMYEKAIKGVGYCAVFDAAEGAVNPVDAKDRNFGLIFRAPRTQEELDMWAGLPVVVATIQSTLPTVAFARSAWPVLRHYNNALLAAERGHGKDNEAFGLTLEDWPYWYTHQANATSRRHMLKKGFDTNRTTRTACLDKIRDWVSEYDADEDPNIRDALLFQELGTAIVKETMGGKVKCDHPEGGSLDGVICLGIATYILQESPDLIVCNSVEEDTDRRGGFMRRVFGDQKQPQGRRPAMGQGVADSWRI